MMKELKKLALWAVILLSALFMNACGDPEPEPKPEPEPEVKDCYFDLYVSVGKHGGMSQNKNGTLMRSVKELTADQPMVEFTGKGVEITSDYTLESITRGKYYYQVPQNNANGFVKFHVAHDASGNESIVLDAEVPFKDNTYYARKYTHAFVDEGKTLIVVGTDSKHTKVYWSKLNEADLQIKAEGTLNISLPEGYDALSTAGLLTYRETDGKLFYFYVAKKSDSSPASGSTVAATSVTYIAVIDPATMTVTSNKAVPGDIMEQTTGTAYGELMQSQIMYDEDGTMYVAGIITGPDGKKEYGYLRRIKAGSTNFDPSYNAFPNSEGKLLTIQYLGGGKCLAYSRDEELGTATTSVSCMYTIVDLATCKRERVKYNGQDLRICSGRFSQRSAIVNGKAYIGVTEGTGDTEYATIYIYDCKTGAVEEGVKLQKGLYFDLIRAMDAE